MGEKTIGVLGGMGTEATLYLFEKIIQVTPAYREQDQLRVIIDNNPKIPDRTKAIFGKGENPVPMMVRSGLSLAKAGADFLVIPCVSAHFFLEELRHQLSLPIVSILDETGDFLARNHPGLKTVGLVATTGTIHGGFFQKRLLESGIKTLVSEPDDQQRVMSSIYRIKGFRANEVREETREVLIDVANRLIEMGSEAIIAGCTEIPLVLETVDVSVPLLDTVLILARAAVREAWQRDLPLSYESISP